jgi:hypothetical protein
MLAWLAAMGQDFWVIAASFFEGVGEDRQTVEGTVFIDGLGEGCTAPLKLDHQMGFLKA